MAVLRGMVDESADGGVWFTHAFTDHLDIEVVQEDTTPDDEYSVIKFVVVRHTATGDMAGARWGLGYGPHQDWEGEPRLFEVEPDPSPHWRERGAE